MSMFSPSATHLRCDDLNCGMPDRGRGVVDQQALAEYRSHSRRAATTHRRREAGSRQRALDHAFTAPMAAGSA
jgi:hypothetical protein